MIAFQKPIISSIKLQRMVVISEVGNCCFDGELYNRSQIINTLHSHSIINCVDYPKSHISVGLYLYLSSHKILDYILLLNCIGIAGSLNNNHFLDDCSTGGNKRVKKNINRI